MRNDKGFTLVELLAVIAILAIVALITTPAITSVINNSRKSAAEDKAWGTIESINTQYATDVSTGSDQDYDALPLTFNFNEGSTDVTVKGPNGTQTRKITMKGERPVSGSVTLGTDGTLTCSKLKYVKNGKYECSTDAGGNTMKCDKVNN